MDVVIGVDVGTSGARAFAVNRAGVAVARASQSFSGSSHAPRAGWAEQNPALWWEAVAACLRALSGQLGGAHVAALAVDSTSGTFVPLDATHRPLMPAIMYNDLRAAGLEGEVNAAAGDSTARMGYSFPPAFALVKMAWLAREQPALLAQASVLAHAADVLNGHLTGVWDLTDTSNALKTGVDLLTGEWPPFIESLGVPLAKLPRVVRPAEPFGAITEQAAHDTGLRAGTPVVAGATDGTASFLASGAHQPGDWNITIGSTIVLRGVDSELHLDPQGRFYSHRHPDGFWLPGGASNVGGEALRRQFGARIPALDDEAAARLPTALLCYPLVQTGERMPFVHAHAQALMQGTPVDEAEHFAALVEGIALVAAWSLREAEALGMPTNGRMYFTGGATHGRNLGRVLASVLDAPLHVPAEPEAAFGSALLAAGWAWYGGSVSKAQAALIHPDEVIAPHADWTRVYQDKLGALKDLCRQQNFL
ncbi:MAG TPA: FGGY-family carbohydrate kinase [Candidatus Limnocylindrales bacterium]|nr:FGGY-family carbohydrate kinase [Candidatus Limnocylindrales bacterium]